MAVTGKLWNRNFIIACTTYFLYCCSFNLFLPTIPIYLSEVLHVDASKIGLVLSSYVISLLFMRPFSGYLVDIYHRKKLLVLGISFFVACYVGYYFAITVVFFVALRFVHGIFYGLSTVSANTVAIDIIPSEKRAEGIGYFGVMSNVAMALAPYIGVKIYDHYGFNSLVTAALIMGIITVIVLSFIKVPKRKKLEKTPPLSFDRFILLRALPIFWNQIPLAFGWGTLSAFAVLYGKDIGIQNAGLFFLFCAGGIVLSRVKSGKLIDHGYLHPVVFVSISAITVGFASFALFHSIYLFCIAAFIIGIGYGILFPSLQTIYVNMAPSSQRGTANSTYLTGFDVGVGLGMLVGAYLGGKLGFANLYLIDAGLSLLALILYWFHSRFVFEKHKLLTLSKLD